jgi:hypothetical protein
VPITITEKLKSKKYPLEGKNGFILIKKRIFLQFNLINIRKRIFINFDKNIFWSEKELK